MCPRQQFRYKPHTMLTNYPRLFESKCIRVLIYQHIPDEQLYCLFCYEITNQPDNFEITLFHGLLDGCVKPLNCSICKQDLIQSRKAMDCSDCFSSYFELIGYFRFFDIDYKEIRILFYDIIEREVLTLVLYDDDDEDEN